MNGFLTPRRSQRPEADAASGPDLATLVEAYTDRVYGYLRALTGDEEMAADLTQETFLKLQEAWPRLEADRIGAAYVFAVARNTALSLLRRKRWEGRHISHVTAQEMETIAGPHPDGDPSRDLERSELGRALLGALAEVPENLRTVFVLAEVEGLSYAEIAQVVGCPTGTVASRKHLAVQRLRQALRRCGHAL